MASGSAQALCAFCEARVKEFNAVNVATALNQLAKRGAARLGIQPFDCRYGAFDAGHGFS